MTTATTPAPASGSSESRVAALGHARSAMQVAGFRAGQQRVAISMTVALTVATLLLTRHAQIPVLTSLAAPWALLIVVAYLRPQPSMAAVMPVLVYGAASMVGAALAGHDATITLRFFVILVGTLLAFQVRPLKISAPWVLAPILLQALLISVLSIGLALLQDPLISASLRSTALENEWGDIYSFDGTYHRVQVIGNALLPFAFLVCLWSTDRGHFYRWGLLIASLGLVAAGNLTYILCAGLAIAIRCRKAIARSSIFLALAAAFTAVLVALSWSAAEDLFEQKFAGSDSSMGVRFDQVAVAVEWFSESPARMLFGAGLGAKYPDGRERAYSEHRYIELQALYLTYQIGIVGMLLYALTVLLLARRVLDRDGRLIFWLYILSGVTNPYILDTNQLVATLILVHLFPRVPRFAHA